ncbi:MAG: hypothetical protein HEQ39_13750 [Rhizobacter sp.]
MPLHSAPETSSDRVHGSTESIASPVNMQQATVSEVMAGGFYGVLIGETAASARVGVLLPELVVGDQVLLAHSSKSDQHTIVAILVADASKPWADRAIALQSEQSITLTSGQATLKLTAEGLVRLVALTIEHDARDLVDIDGAEVRIN